MKFKFIALGAALTTAALLAKKHYDQGFYEEIEIPDPSDPAGVDRSKARISKKGFMFVPFQPKGAGMALRDCPLADDEELMLVERNGEKIFLRLTEMAYHHIAQGELGGEKFAVSF